MKLWLALLASEFQANPSRQQSVKTSQEGFRNIWLISYDSKDMSNATKFFDRKAQNFSIKNEWYLVQTIRGSTILVWLIKYDFFETWLKLKAGTYTADGKPHMVQQHPITCLDGLTNVEYQPGDEWTQTRIFDNGPTTGMEGQFRWVDSSKNSIPRNIRLPEKIIPLKIDLLKKESREILDSPR